MKTPEQVNAYSKAAATRRVAGRKALQVLALMAGGITDWRQVVGLTGIDPETLRLASEAELREAALRTDQRCYPIRGEVKCHHCNCRINIVPCVQCDMNGRKPSYKFLRFVSRSNERKPKEADYEGPEVVYRPRAC